MGWVILAPLVNAFCFIWDGIYIGATASKAMRETTLVATFEVFLPTYYITLAWGQNHSLWLAFTFFMIARGIGLAQEANYYIQIPDKNY